MCIRDRQKGTREVNATGLRFDVEDCGAGAAGAVSAGAAGGRVGGGPDAGRRGGVVGFAAGPAERGGLGRPPGGAADRPRRLHRRGGLPGAGRDAARRWGLIVRPGVVGRSGERGAARRERAAERVDVVAVSWPPRIWAGCPRRRRSTGCCCAGAGRVAVRPGARLRPDQHRQPLLPLRRRDAAVRPPRPDRRRRRLRDADRRVVWETYVPMDDDAGLRVEKRGHGWRLVGRSAEEFGLVNDYLGYLVDRRYSPATVRAYAFDLLHLARWLAGEGVDLEQVTIDELLRFLTACRTAELPGRPGANVYSIRDGHNTGYAPTTVNRRLAAVSGLFAFRQLRDPDAGNPVPRGREARVATRGQRAGLLGHVAAPKPRSRLRVREPRRLPRGLDRAEVSALLGSLRTHRDWAIAGLMLQSGLRSAEVLGVDVSDVDIGRGWVRVVGKGDKERRVPMDADVAGAIQTYLLVERPLTDSPRLFVVAKGPHRGQPLSTAGLRTIFRYHRERAGVPAGHPHALRHTFVISPGCNRLRDVGVGGGRARGSRVSGTCRHRWLRSPRDRVDQRRVPGRAGGVAARRRRVVGGTRR